MWPKSSEINPTIGQGRSTEAFFPSTVIRYKPKNVSEYIYIICCIKYMVCMVHILHIHIYIHRHTILHGTEKDQ